MRDADFAHLHVHTTRSLLDGFTHVPDLVRTVKAFGQTACAITDHGNLGSIPSLFREAKAHDIKPIAGLEAYLCRDRAERGLAKGVRPYFHLTLLAQNAAGYANLCRLTSLSYVEGFYHKPRIDLEALAAHADGLMVLSGCVGGWPQQLIINDQEKEALKWCQDVNDIMKGRFFLESQETGELDQTIVNETFLSWIGKHKMRHVVTGDSHYTNKEDHHNHDVLLCIGIGKALADEARMKFVPEQYAIKAIAEMEMLGFPEQSLKNSVVIADMCTSYDLPRAGGFPKREFAYEILETAAIEGLIRRVTPDAPPEPSVMLPEVAQPIRSTLHTIEDELPYWERLNNELEIIKRLGYEDYFLIAHDITSYARGTGLFWTWGRGSSVGSLVAYALGITNIDPVFYNLYFERFLNASRKNPPDIDIDFTDEDRSKIIAFIEETYGADCVSHIAALSTLGPRQLLNDLTRVLGRSTQALKTVLQALPFDPQMKVADMLEDPNIVKSISHYLGKDVVEYMSKFGGISRHASVHAAGVIIDREPLGAKIPMMLSRKEGAPKASQYEYDDLVSLGFEKFDILGVRTLRTIKETARLTGVDLETIPLDDVKTYQMMSRGLTVGVFQLESYGYRKFLAEFRPKNFEDVMMVNALYRPGPMKGGRGLGELIARRRNPTMVRYAHSALIDVLKPTFGIMVYQEQVMKVVQILAGWTLAEADMLRYAVGKKKPELIEEMKTKFLKDCIKMKHSKEFAGLMFADIEFFGRYGWNKAHAAAYGMVTYVSAYLKANYGHEYMTSMLNSEESDPTHRKLLIVECSRMGMRVVRPHVNVSTAKFQVVAEVRGKHILPGLSSIKFIGEKGVRAIIEARAAGNRFSSIENFRSRVPARMCNILAIKFLKTAGAFADLPEKEEFADVPF